MSHTLRVMTYNIHKGLSPLNRHLIIERLREQLRQSGADVIFLQEVQGFHRRHIRRWPSYPQNQHHFLAAGHWHAVYGKNAIYRDGHHGNALLTRWPVVSHSNHDISAFRFEQRGLLHVVLRWHQQTIHALCVHLCLLSHGRQRQLADLCDYVRRYIPAQAPLIIAGDFNDWQQQAMSLLAQPLALVDSFIACHGRVARSFPARWPMLPLDRVYVRGWQVKQARVLHTLPWSELSDHAPLWVELHR